jgi:hypothetical protein
LILGGQYDPLSVIRYPAAGCALLFGTILHATNAAGESPRDLAEVNYASATSLGRGGSEIRQIVVAWPSSMMLVDVNSSRSCSWSDDEAETRFDAGIERATQYEESVMADQVLNVLVVGSPTRLGEYCSSFVTITLDSEGFDAPKVEQFHFVEIYDSVLRHSRLGSFEEVTRQRQQMYSAVGYTYVHAGTSDPLGQGVPPSDRIAFGQQVFRTEYPEPRDVPEGSPGYPRIDDLIDGASQ